MRCHHLPRAGLFLSIARTFRYNRRKAEMSLPDKIHRTGRGEKLKVSEKFAHKSSLLGRTRAAPGNEMESAWVRNCAVWKIRVPDFNTGKASNLGRMFSSSSIKIFDRINFFLPE